jgi:hypothetical protein
MLVQLHLGGEGWGGRAAQNVPRRFRGLAAPLPRRDGATTAHWKPSEGHPANA